ncbi:MAG: hypothetical protein ACXADX_15705 [Candidatus Hodarchaeales archaeon]|jgi:hypothetical protein
MPEPIEVIITDQQGKVLFGAGKGVLSQNQKISGTLTLTLSLFADKVVNEPLQFVRFANHRMIFVSLESAAPGMLAVSLVKKDVKAAQFVPMTSVFLDLVGRLFTAGNLDDNHRETLQSLYEFISMPMNGLIAVPTTSTGFYSAIVLATGLIYDLGFFDVQKIIARVRFCQPSALLAAVEELSPHGILSCFAPAVAPTIGDTGHLVTSEALNQVIRAIGGEGSQWEILARLFGEESNAMRVANVLSTERAGELGSAIDELEASETNLLLDALNNCVLSPEDTIEIVETVFGQKLKEIIEKAAVVQPTAPEVAPEGAFETTSPEVYPEELPPGAPEVPLPEQTTTEIEPAVEPEPVAVPAVEPEPVAVPAVEPEPVAVPAVPVTDLVDAEEILYRFESCPIELAYCEGVPFGQAKPIGLERKLQGIVLRIFEKSKGQYEFEVALHPDRAVDIKPGLDDIISRFEGQPDESYPANLVFSVSAEKVSNVVRGLAWTAITELLRQMHEKLAPPSEALLFLNEGSIMLIPPKRRFDPKQLPSQILKIVKEQEVEVGTAEKVSNTLLLAGATVDQSIMELVVPLKQGAGAAFVPRDASEEMPEIMLWLLTISEVSGVGFSRW